MRIREILEPIFENQIWARSGKQVVRKFRCTSGPRKGRIVPSMSKCYGAPDVKKRAQLKRTKARLGKKMSRRARKTKRVNTASRRVQALNKAQGRRR